MTDIFDLINSGDLYIDPEKFAFGGGFNQDEVKNGSLNPSYIQNPYATGDEAMFNNIIQFVTDPNNQAVPDYNPQIQAMSPVEAAQAPVGKQMTKTIDPTMAIAAVNYGMGTIANNLNKKSEDRYYRKHGMLQPGITSLTQGQRYGSNVYMEDGGDFADMEEVDYENQEDQEDQEDIDFLNGLDDAPEQVQEEEQAAPVQEEEIDYSKYSDLGEAGKMSPVDNSNSSNSSYDGFSPNNANNYAVSNKNLVKTAANYRDYLVSNHGLTKEESSGILGNLFAESYLNSGVTNGIGAFGLAQWLGKRKTNLFNYAKTQGKDAADPYLQLDFIAHELNTNEKGAKKALKGQDLTGSVYAIMNKFERPAEHEKASSIQRRLDFANSVHKYEEGGEAKLDSLSKAKVNPKYLEFGGSVMDNAYINNILKYR